MTFEQSLDLKFPGPLSYVTFASFFPLAAPALSFRLPCRFHLVKDILAIPLAVHANPACIELSKTSRRARRAQIKENGGEWSPP